MLPRCTKRQQKARKQPKAGYNKTERNNSMATFTNQASLYYGGAITNSNVTTAEIQRGVTATKTAFAAAYSPSDTIVYGISITNSGASALDAVTVSDDLGSYASAATTVVPLSYIDGSIRLYINGAATAAPTVGTTSPLTISGISIPAGGNALLLYEAQVNALAPLAAGSTITNTATVGGIGEPITAEASLPVRNEVNLTLAKAVCPTQVSADGNITYTFIVQNSGNTATTAADNVAITDTFTPPLSGINATLDGAAFTDFTYDATTGLFTTTAGALVVPAATYTEAADGTVITTPGVTVLTVSGSINA